LIAFKNKSEEQAFMRVATRIYSLHTQSKDEVIYTYQRVFKYLLETLPAEEFEQLSFFAVNKLIEAIFQTKFLTKICDPGLRKTVKQFISNPLDLVYLSTTESDRLLHPDNNIKLYFTEQLWHTCKSINVNNTYNPKDYLKTQREFP
jgi:hypothetical protein